MFISLKYSRANNRSKQLIILNKCSSKFIFINYTQARWTPKKCLLKYSILENEK